MRERASTTRFGLYLLFSVTVISVMSIRPAPCAGAGHPEADDVPTVALLPFDGHEAAVQPRQPLAPARTSDAIGQVLALRQGPGYYRVLQHTRWLHVAQRKFHGKATELQGIARELHADAILGGWLERVKAADAPKPYQLTVALYNNWAEPLGQVTFDLATEQVNPDQLAAEAAPLYQMIDQALGLAEPVKKQQQQRPAQGSAVQQAEDSEPAPLPKLQPVQGPGRDQPFLPPGQQPQVAVAGRPPWRPFFNLEAGYLYTTRHLEDSDGLGHSSGLVAAGGASGLRLNGEIYPLALADRVPLAAAGLGARITAEVPFWANATGQNEQYSVTEYRVEVGFLRWHWNFLDALLRPDVDLEALYGYHEYVITGIQNVITQVPSAVYQYVGGTAGMRLHFLRSLSARVSFTGAGMTSLGPMADMAPTGGVPSTAGTFVYGPGSGWLWRVEASAAYRLWRGLTVGAGGYYEQNRLSFTGTGNIPCAGGCKITQATDANGGFYLNLGYIY